jgi:hypothetical protein
MMGRLQQISNELHSLQARALRRVEEIENDHDGTPLPSEVQKMFHTMQRLITRV